MSIRYDNAFLDIPDEIPYENYAYKHGVEYARIPGYYDYFVTSDGNVISFIKEKPTILSTWPNQYGHEYVQLTSRNGTKEKISVHRLVAKAFISNPMNLPIVRHLNDVPNDNSVDNLAWGTALDNRNDCVNHGRDFKKAVYCFELDRHFNSCADAAAFLKTNRSSITQVCSGDRYTVRGMHFCYEDDLEEKKKDYSFLNKYGNNKSLKAINVATGVIQRFSSRKEAARVLKLHDSSISNVLAGRLKQTGGWRFEEGELI